jgi:hypothetical protein
LNSGASWQRGKIVTILSPNWDSNDLKGLSAEVFLVDWGQTKNVQDVTKSVIFIDDADVLNVPELAFLITVEGKMTFYILTI